MKHHLVVIMVVAGATTDCGSLPDSQRIDAVPVAAAASTPRAVPQNGMLRPVRIACIQDKSGSALLTRTPQLERDDLAPLIELIRERGGELAVGIIHASIRAGMARLRIDPSPLPPAPPASAARNPLDEAEQESARHDEQVAFEHKRTDWETEVNNRLETFHSDLDALLKVHSDSRTSPVWSAIERADLFLGESDASWSELPARYGIVLSDGEDNTVHTAPVLSAGAVWLIVNGDGRVGALGALKAKRFESVRAAFTEVVAIERGR